ncbi:MAG: calcium/sodium antiporter [Anaerolineales bacterium]|nr:calcium/sodium antiporter [Anaerolineales bacterium]
MSAVINLSIIVLSIYFLSIITDEFFIESLDEIARKWKLPSNVAGASLMAMGSSMPELSIALLALVQDGGAHSDVGVGNIVGSAVFNILVITGASALARPAKVTWQVVVRDCLIYSISIGLLLFTFQDGQITLLETLMFLGLYAAYIYVLYQWHLLMPDGEMDIVDVLETEIQGEETKSGIYYQVTTQVARFVRFLTGEPRQQYGRAFFVSILLIIGISWLLLENAIAFAGAIGVPPILVALTILAGGSSVPDLLASVFVARDGKGEMAISNAVGSNIFDISIGLGLPWLLILIFQGGPIAVGTADLASSTMVLLSTVVVLFVFLSTGQQLSRREGAVLLLLYAAYVLWMWTGSLA